MAEVQTPSSMSLGVHLHVRRPSSTIEYYHQSSIPRPHPIKFSEGLLYSSQIPSAAPTLKGGSYESKDFSDQNGMSKPMQMDGNTTKDGALSQIRTSSAVSISPELFEKFYLSPQNKVSGDLRKKFGNPTLLYVS
jgi:hypothetical protein